MKILLAIIIAAIFTGNISVVYANEIVETITSEITSDESSQLLEEDETVDELFGDNEESKHELFESESRTIDDSLGDEGNIDNKSVSERELDVVLNDECTIEQFMHVMDSISVEIKIISSIPEISFLHLSVPDSLTEEEIKNNNEVQSLVYAFGNLPQIDSPKNPINNATLSDATLGQYRFSSRMTNEEMFYNMAWHVNEVTNDGKSLEIAKGNGSSIAIIDSGIDITHPILQGKVNISESKSFVNDDDSIIDYNGHGTQVAGIITQIAPDAELVSYKVIGLESGESQWTIEAVIEAANDGNDIINMSLGTYKSMDIESEKLTIEVFERAIEFAESKNAVIVASAGNKALDLDQYYETEHIRHLPGSINGVISVSAVNESLLSSYSNYGSNITLCAPGGDLVYNNGLLDLSQWIYCIYPQNLDNGLSAIGVPQGYTFSYGTSLAAPVVSAGIADILSLYLEKNQNVLKEQLISNATNSALDLGSVGKDNYFGFGEMNVYNALDAIN